MADIGLGYLLAVHRTVSCYVVFSPICLLLPGHLYHIFFCDWPAWKSNISSCLDWLDLSVHHLHRGWGRSRCHTQHFSHSSAAQPQRRPPQPPTLISKESNSGGFLYPSIQGKIENAAWKKYLESFTGPATLISSVLPAWYLCCREHHWQRKATLVLGATDLSARTAIPWAPTERFPKLPAMLMTRQLLAQYHPLSPPVAWGEANQ